MSRHNTHKGTFGNFKTRKNFKKQSDNVKNLRQNAHENFEVKAPLTEEGSKGDDN